MSSLKLLLVEAEGERRHFKSVRRGRIVGNVVPPPLFYMSQSWWWILGKMRKLCPVDQPLFFSSRVCSEMGHSQRGAEVLIRRGSGSGLSQGLCEGLIRGILLHLWDHDAPVELF